MGFSILLAASLLSKCLERNGSERFRRALRTRERGFQDAHQIVLKKLVLLIKAGFHLYWTKGWSLFFEAALYCMPLSNQWLILIDLIHWWNEALDNEIIIVSLRRQLIHALDLLRTWLVRCKWSCLLSGQGREFGIVDKDCIYSSMLAIALHRIVSSFFDDSTWELT